MGFREDLAKEVAEQYSILNEDLIIKNNSEELTNVVLDIVRNIPIRVVLEDKKGANNKKKKKGEVEKPKTDVIAKVSYISHKVRFCT